MINELTIKARCTSKSFERGRRYYQGGAIFSVARRGDVIEGECQGSRYETYRVKVTLKGDEIVDTSCSCPYDWGGDCKHIVALLLTWVNDRERFVERPSIDEMLADKSKEELIALIKMAVKREPSLETLFELPLPVGQKSGPRPAVDPENYRRRIRAIIKQSDYDWDSLHSTAHDIGEVCDIGCQFLEGGDPANAARVFQVVIEEGLFNYHTIYDDDGIVSGVLTEAVGGLCECLDATPGDQPDERMELVKVLYGVVVWDTEQGGYGFDDAAWETLVEKTTPGERKWLREQSQAALDGIVVEQPGPGASIHFEQTVFANFLLELYGQDGDDETFMRMAREYGQHMQLFERLVGMGRIKEALEVAHAHFRGWDVTSAAEILIRSGQSEVGIKLVEDAYWAEESDQQADWLINAYRQRGQNADALKLLRRKARERPDLQVLQDILDLADGEERATYRAELITMLEEKEWWGLLTRFYMAEEDWEHAWAALDRHSAQPAKHAWQGLYEWRGHSTALDLADASAHVYPDRALSAYCRSAEGLIGLRGRDNYREAAVWLGKAREIYVRQGRVDEWEVFIKNLKEENRTLRALQDELQKAGL